jgi:hypothetical protein
MYSYENILFQLFSKNKKYIHIYVYTLKEKIEDQISNDGSVNYLLKYISDNMIEELKKYKTNFAYCICQYCEEYVSGANILNKFNDPTTISIVEWFKLPLVRENFSNDDKTIPDKLNELLKYSYTYKHYFYGLNKLMNVSNSSPNKQIISNFLAKIGELPVLNKQPKQTIAI